MAERLRALLAAEGLSVWSDDLIQPGPSISEQVDVSLRPDRCDFISRAVCLTRIGSRDNKAYTFSHKARSPEYETSLFMTRRRGASTRHLSIWRCCLSLHAGLMTPESFGSSQPNDPGGATPKRAETRDAAVSFQAELQLHRRPDKSQVEPTGPLRALSAQRPGAVQHFQS